MRKRKAAVIACLLLFCLFNYSAPFEVSCDESVILDPIVKDVQRWENAWTETFFGNGSPPFTTVVHSEPQVVWNGTTWVSHELKQFNDSSILLRTPTCTYVVGEAFASLYASDFSEIRAGIMGWIVEQYSLTHDVWLPKTIQHANICYNSSHLWQTWTFADDSERTLYIGCDNKQTVTFSSKSPAIYRLVWGFTNIRGTRMVYDNGTLVPFESGFSFNTSSFCFNNLAFLNDETTSLLLDSRGIDESYHGGLRLRCIETGSANVELVYGNWTLGIDETLMIDPETETKPSEASLDGTIYKWGTSYPPSSPALLQHFIYVGQQYSPPYYYVYRGFVSFNTSSLRDYAVIVNATLKLKVLANYSKNDFMVRVMGGLQPIYGSSFEIDDWNCSCSEVASWSSELCPADNTYASIQVPPEQVNAMGRTQFQLRSSKEGQEPANGEFPEYIIFYAAEFNASEPRLEITWMPDIEYVQGTYWHYWHHSSNKVAIALFGGVIWYSTARVWSIYLQDEDGQKEKIVNDLYSAGFDVISPKRDAGLPPEEPDYVVYSEYSDWIYNATMWLLNEKGYDYVYLFGFSAGGAAVAYEIQKDYASVFSAAAIASAPVNLDVIGIGGPIWQSAHTADKVKTCTSFIVGKDDYQLGDIYAQMSDYFNNTNAHKEWHKWDDGHDIFLHTCLTHPGETVSEAIINWYNKHLQSLRSPSFEDRLRDVYGCAHWETDRSGWRELRGDVTEDGYVGIDDIYLMPCHMYNKSGDRDYDWRLDLNGDEYIGIDDLFTVVSDFGKVTNCTEGAYSQFINGGTGSGSYYMWQWLNHSVKPLKGKEITFEFWFKPNALQSSSFVQAMIYYKDAVGDNYVGGSYVYYNQRIWYKASVTMPIAFTNSTTAIKVMIRWNPDFKAWIDNATLTILP